MEENFPNMEDHFTFMEELYKNHDLAAFLRFQGSWDSEWINCVAR